MAKGAREKPKFLSKKLKHIRLNLGLSQGEMLKALKLSDRTDRSLISGYELGKREPTLLVLLSYARLADISTDALIDDSTNL